MMKKLLFVAAAVGGAVLLKKNWGKLFGASAKKTALQNAENINKKFTTSAQKIDDFFGIKPQKSHLTKAQKAKKRKADKEYVKFWEDALKERELKNAENICKPFSTSSQAIEKQIGIKEAISEVEHAQKERFYQNLFA